MLQPAFLVVRPPIPVLTLPRTARIYRWGRVAATCREVAQVSGAAVFGAGDDSFLSFQWWVVYIPILDQLRMNLGLRLGVYIMGRYQETMVLNWKIKLITTARMVDKSDRNLQNWKIKLTKPIQTGLRWTGLVPRIELNQRTWGKLRYWIQEWWSQQLTLVS